MPVTRKLWTVIFVSMPAAVARRCISIACWLAVGRMADRCSPLSGGLTLSDFFRLENTPKSVTGKTVTPQPFRELQGRSPARKKMAQD